MDWNELTRLVCVSCHPAAVGEACWEHADCLNAFRTMPYGRQDEARILMRKGPPPPPPAPSTTDGAIAEMAYHLDAIKEITGPILSEPYTVGIYAGNGPLLTGVPDAVKAPPAIGPVGVSRDDAEAAVRTLLRFAGVTLPTAEAAVLVDRVVGGLLALGLPDVTWRV